MERQGTVGEVGHWPFMKAASRSALGSAHIQPTTRLLKRSISAACILGEGDLGDAGLVAEVVHEAVEVGVHGRHREQREREELRQDEDGCQRQSGRRPRSY